MTASWKIVDADSKCPICDHDHRCKVAPDGNAVRCFRIDLAPDGWRVARRHPSGGATFQVGAPQQRAKSLKESKAAATPTPKYSTRKLSSRELDKAYCSMLGHLSLGTLHRIALRHRKLSDADIDRFGYRSLPTGSSRTPIAAKLAVELGDSFASVPGFGYVDGKATIFCAEGIAIPVRNGQGEIVAITVRADRPQNGNKYLLLSSKKHGGNSPGAPPHVPVSVRGPVEILRLTEGHLKADVVRTLDSTPTISCGGVGMYRSVIEVARHLDAKTIRLAYDADCETNTEVATHVLGALRFFQSEGFKVEFERWAATDGKGLDDLLANGKQPVLLTGDDAMAAAEEVATKAGVNPDSISLAGEEIVERLRTVLEDPDRSAMFKDEELLRDIASQAPQNRALYSRIRTTIRQSGVPIKDFDFAVKKLVEQAARDIAPQLARDAMGGFHEEHGCICRTRDTSDGPKIIQMCNFTARIIDETTRDDGAEQHIVFGIDGQLSNELSSGRLLPRIEVVADQFAKLEWVVSGWGSDCVVFPGEFRAVPVAIQLFSQTSREENKKPKQRRTVFEHTGWRNVDGQWRYLHANGAIPVAEDRAVSVELSPPLSEYRLPVPPSGDELISAIRASLSVLTIAPRRTMFPLLAAVYRAVVGTCDFGVSLVGPSGIGKSELAALAQQHFGPSLDARHLPGSWSSTVNFVEKLAFLTKDSLLIVDDYAPSGTPADVHRYRQSAERLFRAQGNSAGRGRMKHDGTLRRPTPPRGLIISTGEDVAGGQSARARQLILEVSPGNIYLPGLTPHQRQAAEGVLAASMAGFIDWIAPRYEKIQRRAKTATAALRDRAKSERQHARTPGIIADLAFGFHLFLEFAKRSEAITNEQFDCLKEECWRSLAAAAEEQESHQVASDPPRQFIHLLSSALTTGRVHLADAEFEGPPEDRNTWGWHKVNVGNYEDWKPRGQRIGWVDGEFVLLDASAAFAEAQRYAGEQGHALPITERTLCKMLQDRGLLAAVDEGRDTRKVRRVIHGKRLNVLCLLADTLSGGENLTNPTTEAGKGIQAPSAAVRFDANLRCRYPDVSPDDGADMAAEADVIAHGQVDGRVNGQVFEPQPTTTEPVKDEEKSELVGLGRSASGGEGLCEMEEYVFG